MGKKDKTIYFYVSGGSVSMVIASLLPEKPGISDSGSVPLSGIGAPSSMLPAKQQIVSGIRSFLRNISLDVLSAVFILPQDWYQIVPIFQGIQAGNDEELEMSLPDDPSDYAIIKRNIASAPDKGLRPEERLQFKADAFPLLSVLSLPEHGPNKNPLGEVYAAKKTILRFWATVIQEAGINNIVFVPDDIFQKGYWDSFSSRRNLVSVDLDPRKMTLTAYSYDAVLLSRRVFRHDGENFFLSELKKTIFWLYAANSMLPEIFYILSDDLSEGSEAERIKAGIEDIFEDKHRPELAVVKKKELILHVAAMNHQRREFAASWNTEMLGLPEPSIAQRISRLKAVFSLIDLPGSFIVLKKALENIKLFLLLGFFIWLLLAIAFFVYGMNNRKFLEAARRRNATQTVSPAQPSIVAHQATSTPDSKTASSTSVSIPSVYGSLGGRRLNLRTAPDPSSRVIRTLVPPEKILILGEQGGWYRVAAKGQEGWVAKKYVEIIK